jgi:hypothetical protein
MKVWTCSCMAKTILLSTCTWWVNWWKFKRDEVSIVGRSINFPYPRVSLPWKNRWEVKENKLAFIQFLILNAINRIIKKKLDIS